MTRALHQLLPVYAYGDAIGGAVARTQAMLRRRGFASEVFAGTWDGRLSARPAAEVLAAVGPEDALIYHLSIGSPVARHVERVPGRRVIVYHNITPPLYFAATNPEVTYWCERGREELRRLVPLADLVIGDSAYNVEECVHLGARRTAVIPPPVDLDRLRPRPAEPSSPPCILFVGRTAPNKRHDTLIRALAVLRATDVPGARLRLLGNSYDTAWYLERLRGLVAGLGLGDAVDLSGEPVADATVSAAYASASVFACASAHEGFCVPLLEAMAFDVPIVALSATAIPDTLGSAGLLLDDRDPYVWAAALGRTILDRRLREELIRRGRRRVADFAEPRVEARLVAALAEVGITP